MSRIDELCEAFEKEKPAQLLDAKLELLSGGNATVSAVAREDLCVFAGMIQGGLTATIANYAGVFAAMSTIPSGHCRLRNINVTFIRPIKEGERFVATATVRFRQGPNLFVEAQVLSGRDNLLAAVCNMEYSKPPKG